MLNHRPGLVVVYIILSLGTDHILMSCW